LTRPAATTLLAATVIGLVGLPTGVGYAAYQHDRKVAGLLPQRTLVGGIDVSGLTRSQAVAAVERAISSRLDRPAALLVDDKRYVVTARQLGVAADVPAAVDAALAAAQRGSWLSRSWGRLRGKAVRPVVDVKLTDPVVAGLERTVARAAADVAVPAVDADARLVDKFVTFTAARPGLALDKAAALSALQSALLDGKARRVDTHPVQPKVTDAAFDTVILVHVNENKLYVYKHHQIAATFNVATGMAAYPTPLGRFSVTRKRFMPTWVNPHPNSGWGRFEPRTIAPGPHNPLGLRALNISAPNIRIHGTPSDSSIGYNASHGCIRMHNSDVVKLYPMIPKGTTVFITKVGPLKSRHSHTTTQDPAPTEGG
jgi:lipoprotein-anchoring transpeptidase ErfK/SrfK